MLGIAQNSDLVCHEWERWLMDWMFESWQASAPEVKMKIKGISVVIPKIRDLWVLDFFPTVLQSQWKIVIFTTNICIT